MPRIDASLLRRRIAELDSEEFALRRQAMEELATLGELAEPALREARGGELSPEAGRRVDELLDRVGPVPAGERLRQLRAVEALEQMGTSDACLLLEALAQGAPEVRLTEEARRASERLRRRLRGVE